MLKGFPVRVFEAGNIVEAVQLANTPRQYVRKLDKYRYYDIRTGEVKRYTQTANRGADLVGIRRSVRKLRRLINTNFFGSPDEIMLTLTYAKNQMDVKAAYLDLRRFIRSLRCLFKELSYIAVIEPQARGAWHFHVLIKNQCLADLVRKMNEKQINHKIAQIWAQGFVMVRPIFDIDNVGAYLSGYMINDGSKKGARLHYYPKGIRLYRCSKDIKKPVERLLSWDEFQKQYGNLVIDFENENVIFNSDGEIVQTIHRRSFNHRRIAGGLVAKNTQNG